MPSSLKRRDQPHLKRLSDLQRLQEVCRFLSLIIVTFEIWNYIVVITYFLLSVDLQAGSAPSPGMLAEHDPLGEEAGGMK